MSVRVSSRIFWLGGGKKSLTTPVLVACYQGRIDPAARVHATTVDGEMYNVTKYRLLLNMIRKRQRTDVERESVVASSSCYSGSLLAGRVLGELITDQSHMHKVIYGTRRRYFYKHFTFCCLHYQHGRCMPSRSIRPWCYFVLLWDIS